LSTGGNVIVGTFDGSICHQKLGGISPVLTCAISKAGNTPITIKPSARTIHRVKIILLQYFIFLLPFAYLFHRITHPAR
jgi:hypothetical protein